LREEGHSSPNKEPRPKQEESRLSRRLTSREERSRPRLTKPTKLMHSRKINSKLNKKRKS